MSDQPTDSATVGVIRRVLMGVLLLGLVGTEIELLLLKHFDGPWQIAPLALLGGATPIALWCAWNPGRVSLQALQTTMALFIISGGLGVILHYRGNVEWELERTPGLAGFELFKMSIMGATPTLAPGTMLQLGVVGLLYAYRHPALRGAEPSPANEKQS